jgi:phage baseplate assembly protein W
MAIPQTIRVNPLDLQKNIAIGVSLPFNGPSGPFNKTYSTKDQTKSNLLNLLLTNKGERIFNPQFGADLRKILFEGITEDIVSTVQNLIIENIYAFIPTIDLVEVIVDPDIDHNKLSVTVNYRLKLSGTSDQVTVEFI